ncbi:Ras GTPase activating protein ira2 [Geranomyces variabilis]|nr:Ras GTPase activating protein ira2 [Geranomyces variabilis]
MHLQLADSSQTASGTTSRPSSARGPRSGGLENTRKLCLLTSASDHSSQTAGYLTSSLGPTPADPPPLDESLARFILSVITRFFYTSASTINTDTINHAVGLLSDDHVGATTVPSASLSAVSTLHLPQTTADLLTDIHKAAGRVMQYLSASNWPIIFAKIKSRISSLAQSAASASGGGGGGGGGGAASSSDLTLPNDREGGDLTELRFLEWCSLNRHRLGMILAEITHNCKTFSKRALFATAISLRIAIWSWIDSFPAEFQNLCQSQTRMEGSPDQLFDIFNAFADSTRRKALFWPVQTMLIILCPDIIYAIGLSSSGGDRQKVLAIAGGSHASIAKKALFLESIRKNIRSGKTSEASAFCCVDFVKASTYLSRAEGGPLKLIGAALEVELKEKLFDPQRPLTLTNAIGASEDPAFLDHRLLGECVTALYKSNPWGTLRTIVPVLAEANGPLWKVAFVRAFCTLVSETDVLPWNPIIDASVATHIRVLFSECAVQQRQTADAKSKKATTFRSAHTDKKLKKAQQEEANDRFQILINILTMWNINPLLAIAKDAGTLHPEELRPLFTSLTTCLLDAHSLVRHLAEHVLVKLMSKEMAVFWDGTVSDWRIPPPAEGYSISESAMRSFWRGSSWILLGVTRSILDDVFDARKGAEMAATIVGLRNQVLSARKGIASVGADAPERFAACVAMEVAIIVSLSGGWGDGAVGRTVAVWLEGLLEEGDLVRASGGAISGGAAPLLENASVYADLVRVIMNGGGGGGLKVVQKRARAILRGLSVPTPGNMGGWEEVYKIWKAVGSTSGGGRKRSGSLGSTEASNGEPPAATESWSGSPAAGQDDDAERTKRVRRAGSGISTVAVMGDDRGEWINQMAFLCALGGICLKASAMASEQQNMQEGGSGSYGSTRSAPDGVRRKSTGSAPQPHMVDSPASETAPAQPWTGNVGAQLMSAYSGARATVERFISELVELVVSDAVITREAVKESLGLEMGAGMYGILFQQFAGVISSQLYDGNNQPRLTPRNTLFADYIASVLRLALDRPDTGTVLASSVMGDVDLGFVIVQLLRYLDALVTIDPTSLRIRMRLCTAVELLVAKRDVIDLCGEMRVRREVADALLGQYTVDGSGAADERSSPEVKKLQKGADLACVKALARLLEDLPLGNAADRYCAFLVRGFERWSIEEEESREAAIPLAQSQSASLNTFREHTIQALTHLVAANPDMELGAAMDMVYSENESLRGVFAVVLANLVKSGGIEEKVRAALGSKADMRSARHGKLLELLTETTGGIDIAVALGEVAGVGDVDDVAAILVAIFEDRGKSLDLIERVVQREVENTDTPANLFRRNSIATRLLTIYAKQQGQEYIRGTLRPIIFELSERCPPMSFEVDPIKLRDGEDAEANLRNLKVVSQGILDSVIGPGATTRFPTLLRQACGIVWRLVGTRFPDARVTAVGGFLFLRFICPAIVSPETHGIIDAGDVRKELRRGLVLITKVVQNLANNVLFGVKEAFMAGANDVLRDNVARVHGFLRDVSAPVQPPPPLPVVAAEHQLPDGDLIRLHRHLAANLDRIERLQRAQSSSSSVPPSPAGSISSNSTTRMSRRSVSHLSGGKDDVVGSPRTFGTGSPPASPASKRGHRQSKSVHAPNSPALAVDTTPLPQSRSEFADLCTLLAQLGPAPDPPTASFASDDGVKKRSFHADSAAPQIFSQVAWIKGYRTQLPVLLAVGNEKFQILAKKPDGAGDQVEESIHASDIEEFGISREGEFVVRIVDRGGSARSGAANPTPLAFASPKAEAIVQSIRTMINAYRLHRTNRPSILSVGHGSRSTRDQRQPLLPLDVAGALLNVAFVTFGSADPHVRRTAYELLCAVCREFRIGVDVGAVDGQRVLCGRGVFIPYSNQPFVRDVSTRIARARPELTLALVAECAHGLSRVPASLKLSCLQYLAPWIANLAPYADGGIEVEAKLRKIVLTLVEATIREPRLDGVFRSVLWASLGKVVTLVPMLVDLLMQAALDGASRPTDVDVIANIVHCLACTSEYPVSSKIFSRLRKAIVSTSYRSVPALVDHSAWTEIAVLVRLALHVSFDDWENIDAVVPDVFYIVSMVAGVGSPLVRTSVHGIIINAVHALATSGRLGPDGRTALEALLSELADPKLCLPFGVTPGEGPGGSDVAREVPLGGLELVVKCLLDVIIAGARDGDQRGLWRARWMSFIASTAFQYNPAIQPRAFIVLGCLAREEVDDDLLYQILVALRGALTLFEENDSQLIVSITMSLCDIVGGLPADSRYLRPMFWLALALMQSGHVPVFQSALALLVVVLKTLRSRGCFEREGVARTLMVARDGFEDVAGKLDTLVGIRFTAETFSFALAANLMKGLKHPLTKTSTNNVFEICIDIVAIDHRAAREPWAARLGYLVPLLPSAERPSDLWKRAGFQFSNPVWAEDPHRDRFDDDHPAALRSRACAGIVQQVMATLRSDADNSTIVGLLVVFLAAMLETAEYDMELVTLYAALAEVAEIAPELLQPISDFVMPRVNQSLATSQSLPVLNGVKRIMQAMNHYRTTQPPASRGRPIPNMPPSSAGATSSSIPTGSPSSAAYHHPYHLQPHAAQHNHQAEDAPSSVTVSSSATSMASRLAELGFPGLVPDAASFGTVTRARKMKCAALACELVDAVVAL